ncbi:P-type ATPase [Thiothrix lacustris]|uniref:P-type ATPase n=1 Tax=Thiothrix lacustris TaxID=525917 RepID=UPI0027E4AD41|nr:hypothetical protein [Thiothrix lacustris]WMP19454.1 hypothetical protein RCS87_19380 [Thiothrix lacustris]
MEPSLQVQEQVELASHGGEKVFDDVGELQHYQRVSWYALALSTSGAWFYPPATLVSIPLLGYNAYNLVKTIRQSDKAEQTSPLTIFEVIAVTGTLVTGRPATASVLMLLSFGTRKLLLQAGNISNNIGFAKPFNPRFAKVWTLRDGAEIETSVADLQQGDIVVLHAGETVAVEGKILEGIGTIRQYSLCKQMKLVPKQEGDKVFPFTQVESGCLHVQPAPV